MITAGRRRNVLVGNRRRQMCLLQILLTGRDIASPRLFHGLILARRTLEEVSMIIYTDELGLSYKSSLEVTLLCRGRHCDYYPRLVSCSRTAISRRRIRLTCGICNERYSKRAVFETKIKVPEVATRLVYWTLMCWKAIKNVLLLTNSNRFALPIAQQLGSLVMAI